MLRDRAAIPTDLSDRESSAPRILAVRLDNVGDMVMLGPALRAVRRAYPSASVTLLSSPAGASVAPLLPWVDEVLTHRALWQDARGELPLDPERELDLVRVLASRRFHAALIFTSFSQSPLPPAYVCFLAGIPIRAGQTDRFGGSVLSPALRAAPWAAHQVDRNLHLVEGMGIPAAGRHLELRVPADAEVGADALLGRVGLAPDRPFIVVAPGASCSARRYDPARFGVIAAELGRLSAYPVLLVGSEREHGIESEVLAAAWQRGPSPVSIVGQTTIPELAAIIARSALVVSNDSAAMHIADAFARPIVVLFSGTDLESQWRPRQSRARLLRIATPCAPCYRFDCPYGNACLDIPAERVVDECLRLLADETQWRVPDSPTPEFDGDSQFDGDSHEPAHPHVARPRQLPVLPRAGAP